MQILYKPKDDVIRIIFNKEKITESDEDKPGIIIDYDKDGNMVGIEILDASKRIDNPNSVEYITDKAS